jgi:2-oxoglutarate ferredoxin oxidoreductase subunit alpha
MHARMNEKRNRKLDPLKERSDLFDLEGPADAPLALVAWGSLAGTAREARRRAAAEGLRVKLLVPRLLYPVSETVYDAFFRSVQQGLVVEQSHRGQLFRLHADVRRRAARVERLARSGANPIRPDEVVGRLRQMAMALQRVHEDELQTQE